MQRRPVLIGDPQLGGTCQLSSHSGLPALTAPAGFTNDGLPVGLEMIGRPYDDAKLVMMAAAFEQLGPRRRAPPTTPVLRHGRAPGPVTLGATARANPGNAAAVFRFDPSSGEVTYRVRVAGIVPAAVQAVVLRRGRTGPVIARLSGPGDLRGDGGLTVAGVDRDTLEAGALILELFLTEGRSGAASVRRL